MKSFYQKKRPIIQTLQAFCHHYSLRDSPSFQNKGSVSDLQWSGRPCLVKNETVFEGVRESIKNIRAHQLESGLDRFGSLRCHSNKFLNASACFHTTRWGNSSYDKGHNLASRSNFGEKNNFSGLQHKLATMFPGSEKPLVLPLQLSQRKGLCQQASDTLQQLKDIQTHIKTLEPETLTAVIENALEMSCSCEA